MTLHLNYRDVARANIEHFDRLGAFHGYGDCLYHYFDFDEDGEPYVPTNFCCAIGICDVDNFLEEWNDEPIEVLIGNDHLTADNEEKVQLIQSLHDYKACGKSTKSSFLTWVRAKMRFGDPEPVIPDYINLQSPDDLTPEVYKEIMAKIASE